MFGDHLSFYVAVNNNVDPLNVDPITDIKRTIRDKLERWIQVNNLIQSHQMMV